MAETPDIGKPLPGNKYYRVTDLPRDKLEYVRDMLKRGQSPWYVAKVIQEEWGMYKDVKNHTLGRMIEAYRNDKITDLDIAENVDPRTAKAARVRLLKHANVLDEFTDLIALQRRRLNQAMTTEDTTKFPLGFTTELVAELRKCITAYGEIAAKVGYIQKMTQGNQQDGPRFEPKALEEAFSNDIVRKEMIGVLDSLLEELSGKTDPENTERDEDEDEESGDGDRNRE